jgi:hypothetical protein
MKAVKRQTAFIVNTLSSRFRPNGNNISKKPLPIKVFIFFIFFKLPARIEDEFWMKDKAQSY